MSLIVKNLPRLVAQSTGSGAVTQGIGKLDDAGSITVFMQTSAGLNSSAGVIVQVSQFDPFDASPQPGVSESTGWNTYSTALVTSSGTGFQITNISFRGLRLSGFSSAATNEVVAYVSKSISV